MVIPYGQQVDLYIYPVFLYMSIYILLKRDYKNNAKYFGGNEYEKYR